MIAGERVPHLCAHLTQAVERGVELMMIVESEGESEELIHRGVLVEVQLSP